jgi:hypothetical protein
MALDRLDKENKKLRGRRRICKSRLRRIKKTFRKRWQRRG